jgi:hypothetical protein
MNARSLGAILVAIGVTVVVVGILVYIGFFGWFGRLPGDIRIETDRTRFYFPITSMVIVSIVVSLLLTLWRRLL